MMSSKSKYAFIALVATSFLYSGCQKAAHHPIKGVLGAAAANKTASTMDQKADALVQKGDSKDVCDPTLISKNTALKAELDKTNQALSDDQGKTMSDAIQSDLGQHSSQIQKLEQDLVNQFIQLNIASCGTTDKINLADARQNSNTAILAIASFLGKDTPESAQLKQSQQQQTDAQQPESLVGQSFKLSADLASALTEEDQNNSMFVANGQKGSTKDNYDKAIQNSELAVCLLEKAPATKLEANAVVTILTADVSVSDSLKDSADGKTKALNRDVKLVVSMGSGDQLIGFSCRLVSDLKKTHAPAQFLNAFGSLLIK